MALELTPGLGSLISGGLSFLGGLFSNDSQADMSQRQMDFQERMSSTAYQRAVSDMKSAGLNPMLAYSQGGASSPMGSMPQVQNPVPAAVQSAAATAGLYREFEEVKKTAALTEQVKAETLKTISETRTADLNTAMFVAQLKDQENKTGVSGIDFWLKEGTRNSLFPQIMADADLKELAAKSGELTFASDVARRKAESSLTQMEIPKAKAEEDFYKDLGRSAPYLQWLLNALRLASGAGAAAGGRFR
ncbi:minor capsid protein [Microviridae sp.]|nr:minor capsid protein [Microviridae sp.]